MAVGIFSKIKSLVSKVGKGLSCVNDKIVKPIVLPAAKQLTGFIPGGGLIMKGIEAGSSALDADNGQGSKQDAKDKFNYLMSIVRDCTKLVAKSETIWTGVITQFKVIIFVLSQISMNRFLAKATQVQGLNTIESQLESNAVVPFKNDGEHHYSIKDIKPESQMPALFDKEIIISLSNSDHDITLIKNSFISIVLSVKLQFDNKFEQFDDSYKDGVLLLFGLKSGSNIICEYTVYNRSRTIDGSLQNVATTESFIYNMLSQNQRKILENLFIRYMKISISYILQRVELILQRQILLNELLIFSTFKYYLNGMFGDLKIKFKINPNGFVFGYVNPTVPLVKYYSMNKNEMLSSRQQKLMDIDLFFRNWSLTFKYAKQFTLLGYMVDLKICNITEQYTPSDLKNLVCVIAPVTVSIKNYVVTEVQLLAVGEFSAARF
ncbi:MAG: hypothetical protein EZS28_001190 [Streblomastix strix]|uniref:Uncharacterized protein n=1 Tax=Streblomastix strix TaxID=222440 RepID=A0A5J4X7S2_9EUKA|nr:MAG: hypothetical protein EZS28_001190 [Streblomastix strix]